MDWTFFHVPITHFNAALEQLKQLSLKWLQPLVGPPVAADPPSVPLYLNNTWISADSDDEGDKRDEVNCQGRNKGKGKVTMKKKKLTKAHASASNTVGALAAESGVGEGAALGSVSSIPTTSLPPNKSSSVGDLQPANKDSFDLSKLELFVSPSNSEIQSNMGMSWSDMLFELMIPLTSSDFDDH